MYGWGGKNMLDIACLPATLGGQEFMKNGVHIKGNAGNLTG